ncbi:MAG: precorrin-3B C(17)-methyltransferase, partial [Firmicutes bacterium]|nr:precorrin-3B C(17)-methyltransferase [Bacillota bacterium]
MSKLYVVGIGPGSYENMTQRAQEALKNADILIGYTVYIDLVKEHFPGK